MDTETLKGNSFALRLVRFAEEMGRRRVWRTALAYCAVVFVLLQVGEIVFPAFQAPDWALKLLVVSSLVGFPVVLALAWVFDITGHGIRVTPGRDASDAPHHGLAIPRLALVAVTLSCAGGIGWWTVRDTIRTDALANAPGPPAESPGAATAASIGNAEEAIRVRSLAVLPLDDFSEGDGGAYFTAGLHEELVSQISQRTAARVVSRTSVVQYDRSGKTMPAIAQDLGVDAVVEGSVFRSGNRVRITVQLIHGPSDTHLWAESYEGTLDDAIAFQDEVAEAIANAIQNELYGETPGGEPWARLASNASAHEEYMQGRYEQAKGTAEGLTAAIGHYQSAVEEDSSFAAAFAGMAEAKILLDMRVDSLSSPEELVDGEVIHALQQAFRFDRASPEAQAVVITMREALGKTPANILPGEITVFLDTAAVTDQAVARETTSFGRQMNRVLVERGRSLDLDRDPATRVLEARRLSAAAHFREAEASLQEVLMESPELDAAWDALEDIKAQQEDYLGAVQLRRERMERSRSDEAAFVVLERVQQDLATGDPASYWAWRLADLTELAAAGKPVSPVRMARATLGAGRIEEVFPLLDEALAAKDRNLLSLWTDPGWDVLRTDARFKEILRKLRSHGGSGGMARPDRPGP